MIFLMQLSEFIILVNSGSNLKKKSAWKREKKSFFTKKLIFIDEKYIFLTYKKLYSDRSVLDCSILK